MKLENRTVLITGATSGIGRSLAHKLASRGCKVIAVGRSVEKLGQLKRDLPDVTAIRCDLSKKSDILDLTKQIIDGDVPVSVLINNAAVQHTPKFLDEDFSFDGIEYEVNTNFTSVAWLIAQLLPVLMASKEGSAIVNMSSGLALYPKTSSAIYSATKAAVHSLSQSLRYQLEGSGVAISEIILPLVDTAMTEGRGTGKIPPDAAADGVIDALSREIKEHYVGVAAVLPVMSYLVPPLARRILKNS